MTLIYSIFISIVHLILKIYSNFKGYIAVWCTFVYLTSNYIKNEYSVQYNLVSINIQFSSVVSNSLRPNVLQHARPPCPSPTPRVYSNSMSLLMFIESVMPPNHLILGCPLLLPPSIFLSIRVFTNVSVLCIRWPKYWSFNFNISPSNNIQDWFPSNPTGSQESSPTPQFKSINSSPLSFLYSLTLTSIHEYWKNDSFD